MKLRELTAKSLKQFPIMYLVTGDDVDHDPVRGGVGGEAGVVPAVPGPRHGDHQPTLQQYLHICI